MDHFESNHGVSGLLPHNAHTKSGVEFFPKTNTWSFRDCFLNVSLNFSEIVCAEPLLIDNLKLVLMWYLRNHSPGHSAGLFFAFKSLMKATCREQRALNYIQAVDIMNFRSSSPQDSRNYLGKLAGLFRRWHALGYWGISDDVISFFDDFRIPGQPKGVAVLTHDPEHGPFSDIELESIQSTFNEDFASGYVSNDDFLLGWLFMSLGQRPAQYALLKVCDVVVERSNAGVNEYFLMVPRTKQGFENVRTEFKKRKIVPEIGRLLVQYASTVSMTYGCLLRDPSQFPLFPQLSANNCPIGYEFHCTSLTIERRLVEAISSLGVVSERTGCLIHVTATRFRRTVGTRAAEEGHGELVIAELLDHTDTQNVRVYVEATPEMIERIDRAMALHIAPLAQAFAGLLVQSEMQAVRGSDPTSRVLGPQITGTFDELGWCGKYGFCGLFAPLACYTCSRFEPWVDGPHEHVLTYLIAKRETYLKTDSRIAKINDRTIYAVAQVILNVKAMRLAEELDE